MRKFTCFCIYSYYFLNSTTVQPYGTALKVRHPPRLDPETVIAGEKPGFPPSRE